nr:MAG TPA: Ariadne-1 protein-like protein [Caudoviricetes sp.]
MTKPCPTCKSLIGFAYSLRGSDRATCPPTGAFPVFVQLP